MNNLAAEIITMLQYLVGLYVYLFPKVAIRNRRAMAPIHQFFGRATFTAGLATMAVSTLCVTSHLWLRLESLLMISLSLHRQAARYCSKLHHWNCCLVRQYPMHWL